MSTDRNLSERKHLISLELALLLVALFGMVAIVLEKPVGSIKGQIALAQENFGLYSYNIRKNKVYAVASGPRYGQSISRGVWVSNDGSFEISQLPVGEYSLRFRAPGFRTKFINSVFVEEGKAASLGKAIKMQVLEPYISVGSNMRVFTTEEAPFFWVNATGAVETTVKVYKKNILDEISSQTFRKSGVDVGTDLSIYPTYRSKFHNPYSEEKPYKQLKRTLNPSYTDSARANFKLTKGMEPGDYVIIAEALDVTGKKRVSSISWFSVSDIGLIVKHSPDQTLVRAINLKNNQAIEGAELTLNNQIGNSSNYKLDPADSAISDKQGLVLFDVNVPGKANRNERNIITGKYKGSIAYSGVSYWRGKSKNYNTYFYTDRPVYRLGQEVSYKLITRELNTKGITNPGADIPVSVTVEDPTNAQLETKQIKTSKFGTANGTFNIPEDGKTGAYQMRFTYPDGNSSYQSFEVEQYRKPEYKVEVIPNSKRYVAGGKARVRVKASYFFGAPVANAHIKYSVYESGDSWTRYNLEPRPDYYSFFDDWYEESYYDEYSYGGAMVAEGKSFTDENGEAVIEFDTRKIKSERNRPYFFYDYGERNYKVEADVTDISQLTVTSSASTLVTAGQFALFVEPDSYVVAAGQPLSATVRAIDYDGKPVANQKVTVKLSRWPWDKSKESYGAEKVLGDTSVSTNEKGIAKISFAVGQQFPTDTFHITAGAVDSKGNQIYYGNSVWVSSDANPYVLSDSGAKKEAFKVTLDKKVYEPGQTARVMISGPFTGKEGFDALLSLEGTRIHEYRVVPLKASANLVEIPIKDAYSPNIFVSVVAVGQNKQFYSQNKALQVSPNNHFLDIKIATNKEKYKPGETASYKITARYEKTGKPAANCELSLGVVDESIYSIRSDSTRDIRKFFYQKQYNWVRTLNSFPEQYSGGPDKAVPQIRKNFKDTAAWFPTLVTDSNGEAVATVPLPDNLTTWRATVRGINTACDVGSAVQKILVSKDIIARLALPRFYTKGDRGEIAAIVHNYSTTDQKINISFNPGASFKTSTPLNTTVMVEKDKAKRLVWPIEASRIGESKIQLIARGQTGSDGLERKIKVNPLGISMALVKAGVLTAENNKAPINIDVPAGASDVKTSLRLAGSTLAQVKGSYDSLIDYPYGCTEQTMSRLVPSIVAYKLHDRFGIDLKPENIDKFEKVKAKALKRLQELQHYDGGWGWWSNDSSDPYLTAHVMEGLLLLKESKISLNPTLERAGLKWLDSAVPALQKQLADPKLADKDGYTARTRKCDLARMVYVQTLYGKRPDKTAMNWLNERVLQFTPESLVYLTLANKATGNGQAARAAYKRLTSLATRTDRTMDWDHTKALLKKLNLKDENGKALDLAYDYSYRFTGVETTALALKAMVAMEPGNIDQIEMVKNWLLLQRSENGWSNTKTTAQVMLSLMEEAIKTGSANSTDFVASILKDETVIDSLYFNPSNIFKQEKTFNLASDKLTLSLDNSGSGRLYYQSLCKFYKTLKPGEKLNIVNSPGALSLTRKFFKLQTKATGDDGILKLNAVPLNNGSIKPGEIVLMKVLVETPIRLPYVMIECPLPSGAEVIKNSSREGNLSNEEGGSLIEGDWGSPWWSHQDILDDKLVFFGTEINQGKSEFHTLLRMELPGSVQLNPVTLEGMYTNMVHGYSQARQLEIK